MPPRSDDIPASAEALALVAEFAATLPFPMDPFQWAAACHMADQRSVLVAAPTGTGKTLVAEFAIWLTRRAGQRAIYTAPIKALSNQKFRDLRARYGAAEAGLLTGDIVENPAAPIVVMTTEIYRNMLLEGVRVAQATPQAEAESLVRPVRRRIGIRADGPELAASLTETGDVAEMARRGAFDEELSGVGCVIFDELHFLSDPERGPVWEEAIIHSPAHVTFVGLSATVSNADELRRWIEHVHGPMSLVYHDERAVPLEHYYFVQNELHLVQNAAGQRVERFPNVGGEAKLARLHNRARRFDFGGGIARDAAKGAPAPGASPELPTMVDILQARRQRQQGTTGTPIPATTPQEEPAKERPAPEPGELITALRAAGLLPCLYFLPGRRAVEAAASSAASHLLVSPEQRARLHEEVQEWVRRLPTDDQKLDQVRRLAALLPRGLGFHHAGLLPALKVMVETLFARGDLRAVFATDTLALGINMPARSVVVGSLSKFDGTQMRLLTPNEYQQLTGRAGRRGMDAQGTAVIPYSPWDAFEPAFAQLTAPLLPVTSAFIIRYNTILNLWRPGDLGRLRHAVAASLREYQRREQRAGGQAGRAVDEYALASRKQRRDRENPYQLSRAAATELNATVYVLRMLGYIDEDDELSIRGRMLRAIFHPAGVVLTELLLSGALDDLSPPEMAEVVSWFTYDSSDRTLHNVYTLPQRLLEVRRQVYQTERLVQAIEYEEGVTLSPGIVETFHSIAYSWWRGSSLGSILKRIELAEGDLLVALNQTIDLLQQLQSAVGQVVDARDLWVAPDAHRQRGLDDLRERLAAARPALAQAWQGMLRGSVALSRAIPSMSLPDPAAPTDDGEQDVPPLAMAEDEDPHEAALDLAESPSTIAPPSTPPEE